ncbi:TetR family transcriptional regulator [Streptomyces sp. NRRL F-4489]|uniref:TetR/AcrR family transcriptional regulator n=1 Tax=Streptomyces sp. NRRL F-4489 TaxID=1609095 RepID=UPI0007474D4C|nr:TetR/AcrR family transcriptional regulator [Streptomyces sp. NRRL F-4489]KUL45968.1 TetR family transcriptional regulator [Streptomyces sp. NRRL F-4489]
MARRTDSRRRMLESAAELFHAQGYHATGLNQVVTASGAPKGSLYFHFPGGKEQLAAEALKLSGGQLREALEHVLAEAPDAAGAIGAVVDLLSGLLADSGFQRGCPLAAVTLDAAADSEPIRHACAEGYDSWRELIAGFLTEQGLAADRAETLATVVLASLEGGLLLAKARHDTAPLRAVAEHLKAAITKELA